MTCNGGAAEMVMAEVRRANARINDLEKECRQDALILKLCLTINAEFCYK